MEYATEELREYYEEFREEFRQFLPDIQTICSDFLSSKS
jgi:hypothetical protein